MRMLRNQKKNMGLKNKTGTLEKQARSVGNQMKILRGKKYKMVKKRAGILGKQEGNDEKREEER